jgi:hypothetical protein
MLTPRGLIDWTGASLRVKCRTTRLRARTRIPLALLATALLAGCSTHTPPRPPPPAPPAAPAPGSPRVITNLSQLSASNGGMVPLISTRDIVEAPKEEPKLSMGSHAPGDQTPAALRRLFLNNPAVSRYRETPLPHSQERLLNAKAAKYPAFSSRMLSQLLKEMVRLEGQPPVNMMVLPNDLKPVIVTAVLNREGQLRELIFDQHSGVAAVDKLVIKACKESLWAGSAPEDALAQDGNYRLRIETRLSNYSADREGEQTFITRLGLGIL